MAESLNHGGSAAPLLRASGLSILKPGGAPLLTDVDLELRPGEIVCLLGGSGAGKSTLMQALHDAGRLEASGFTVVARSLEAAVPIGIVPQRGALFDHLSVAGNLALALRNASPPRPTNRAALAEALAHVELPEAWADPGHATTHVSGGEAQRLAVARTLGAGRRILFLDEPSVGLDPLRVHRLADLLREEMHQRSACAVLITHDLEFAAGCADRFIYMDRGAGKLVELRFDLPPGELAARRRDGTVRRALAGELATEVERRLEAEPTAQHAGGGGSRLGAALRERAGAALDAFALVPRLLAQLPGALARPRDFVEVFRVVAKQAVVRPAAFFGLVSVLVGFTLLYIFHRSLGGGELPLRGDKVFGLIGSMHIIALTPALSGILFAATSSNAITAWLGGMSLTRQTQALRALGIAEARYLWWPAWSVLTVAYLVMAAIFTAGMVLGGWAYIELNVPEVAAQSGAAWELITADLLDPPPERAVFRARALALVGIYAAGISADGVARGAREKHKAEDVTVSMVRSVMSTTLWIVGLELISLLLVYGMQGGGGAAG